MGIMIFIVTVIALLIIVLTFVFMFSPKARGKMMSQQVKSMRNMMDESKDDIQNIYTNMADATKDGIEITARALKKGFTEDEGIYCKHCGNKIDNDSKFCKNCGKEQ